VAGLPPPVLFDGLWATTRGDSPLRQSKSLPQAGKRRLRRHETRPVLQMLMNLCKPCTRRRIGNDSDMRATTWGPGSRQPASSDGSSCGPYPSSNVFGGARGDDGFEVRSVPEWSVVGAQRRASGSELRISKLLRSSWIQPRSAKSASAVFAASREAPASWAISSGVKSCVTRSAPPSRAPNAWARISSCLATRPDTSVKIRSARFVGAAHPAGQYPQ
jgi:hypothetical protein